MSKYWKYDNFLKILLAKAIKDQEVIDIMECYLQFFYKTNSTNVSVEFLKNRLNYAPIQFFKELRIDQAKIDPQLFMDYYLDHKEPIQTT